MPVINIEYDDAKVGAAEIQQLSNATQQIVSKITGIEDVFVYANTSRIKVKIAPIEIWVRLTASKIPNLDELMESVKVQLSDWKNESNFPHPINLTIIPMQWKVEIGI